MTSSKLFSAFLAGIDPVVNLKQIRSSIRKKYQGVARIDCPKDQRKGYLFVHFNNKNALQDFLKFGKIQIMGRDLIVKPFLKGTALQKYKISEGKRRLFVKGIPHSWVDQ